MLAVDVRGWVGAADIPDGFNAVFAVTSGVGALAWLFSTFVGRRLDGIEAHEAVLEERLDNVAVTMRGVSDVLEGLSGQVAVHAGLMTAVPAEYTQALCEMRELLNTSYRTILSDATQVLAARPALAVGERTPRLVSVPHRPN